MLANSRVLAADFDLINPRSLEEVLSLLAAHGDRAALLFGGTDLLVQMKMGRRSSEKVINCRWLEELKGIQEIGENLEIGAGSSLNQVGEDERVRREFPALEDAILSIAGPAIRHMGTIGGNVVNASPAADAVVALVAHRARFRLQNQTGTRVVDSTEFFLGPGKTVRRPDEILTHILLARPQGMSVSGHFRKVGRVAGDIAKLSVAVTAEKSLVGVVNWHVAMGSVAPTPVVLCEVEALLNHNRPLDGDITSAIRATVAQSITPIDDVRSTAWYRKRVSGVTVSDLCEQVWKEFEGGKA